MSRILSFFETIPRLGMVVPLTFRQVLGAAHWGDNKDIARELAFRLGWPDSALPEDGALRFPVGSMFWARVAAIRPLLDLALTPDHFPPEAGQVDGTLAHAIERMLGVVCQAGAIICCRWRGRRHGCIGAISAAMPAMAPCARHWRKGRFMADPQALPGPPGPSSLAHRCCPTLTPWPG